MAGRAPQVRLRGQPRLDPRPLRTATTAPLSANMMTRRRHPRPNASPSRAWPSSAAPREHPPRRRWRPAPIWLSCRRRCPLRRQRLCLRRRSSCRPAASRWPANPRPRAPRRPSPASCRSPAKTRRSPIRSCGGCSKAIASKRRGRASRSTCRISSEPTDPVAHELFDNVPRETRTQARRRWLAVGAFAVVASIGLYWAAREPRHSEGGSAVSASTAAASTNAIARLARTPDPNAPGAILAVTPPPPVAAVAAKAPNAPASALADHGRNHRVAARLHRRHH